jgi:hypothetical protein
MSIALALPRPEGLAVRAPDEWTMLWLDRSRRRGRWRVVVVAMSGEAGSFLTTILGAGGPRDERGERFPSALCCMAASLLEEVGEALWSGSLECLELGVTL